MSSGNFGPWEFFNCFLGPAWLFKEAAKESWKAGGHDAYMQRHHEFVDGYVKQYGSLELEQKYMKKLRDPSCIDRLWEQLETYKRQHLIWCCAEDEEVAWLKSKDKSRTGWEFHFGARYMHDTWGRVGKSRCVAVPKWADDTYVKSLARLLVQTHGKLMPEEARWRAEVMFIAKFGTLS